MRISFRFSLAKLLILFTIVAIILSIAGKRLFDSNNQKLVVDALRSDDSTATQGVPAGLGPRTFKNAGSGVRIIYDFESDTDGELFLSLDAKTQANQKGLSRFIDWFGLDYCHNVEAIEFERAIEKEDIALLRKLPGLKRLKLEEGFRWDYSAQTIGEKLPDGSTVLDELVTLKKLEVLELPCIPIPKLSELPQLKELTLHSLSLDATQLKKICDCKTLTKLDLNYVSIAHEEFKGARAIPSLKRLRWSGGGVQEQVDLGFLRNFPNLTDLRLSNQFSVSDAAIKEIGKLNKLESLVLQPSNIRSTRMQKLNPFAMFGEKLSELSSKDEPAINWEPMSNLKRLKHVEMDFDEVSNEAMRHICSASKGIKRISIAHSYVGNKGMDFLESLSNPETIRLGGTRITKTGIAGFVDAHPGCVIVWH